MNTPRARPPSHQAIGVLRPLLPTAEKLLPYLARIDESRVYSNWGPLVLELSDRLASAFGTNQGSVICANSGMTALVGAILAAAGRATAERPLAIVPDFTFTATGLAAQACGYDLAIASCDRNNWTFSPQDLLRRKDLSKVGLVIPVSPFGRNVGQTEWQQFQAATGIPVVIDGAALFEALLREPRMNLGPLPVALSFHATKSFATGEGGCVITTRPDLANRTLQCLNFGFMNSRLSEVPGINGKLSEYAAAVGLAELDGWAGKYQRSMSVCDAYRQGLERLPVDMRLWTAPHISSSYVLLQCRSVQEANTVAEALASELVDTRRWYGNGLTSQPAFRDCVRLDLHGRAALEPQTIVGLPMAVDLSPQQVSRICDTIGEAIR